MSQNDNPKSDSTKRPYAAPRLVRVVLRPEEAVLGACKNAASAGPAGASCVVSSCATSGS